MKSLSNLLFIFAVFIFIKNNSQQFKINEHKIEINLNEILRPVSRIEMVTSLKFMGDFYSIFEETQMYDFGQTQKYLIKYNIQGEILLAEKLPQELHNSHYMDFFVHDNKIYVQLQNNSRYFFDFKTNKFVQTTKGNDLVYEDNNYAIMYKSFGEWGDATWFINKKDKTQNFTSTKGHNTNFLNGKYYLTNIASIAEITNPNNLTKSQPKQDYNFINEKEGIFSSYDYNKGVRFIYKDSTQEDSYNFTKTLDNLNYVFISSFVANKHLYQITQLKDKTAITEVNNNNVDIAHKFNEKYNFFYWHNQYRNTKNNYKFLRFTNGYNSNGFLEINDDNIDITKVNYKYDSIQYIKSDSIINLISLLYKNNISRKEVTKFEKTSKGSDIRQYRNNINHNGYYPKKFNMIDIETMSFVKSNNEFITQDIEYLFTKKEQLKAIYINWDKTKFFNPAGKNYFPVRNENYIESDKKFKQKYTEIHDKLNKIGEQINVKTRPNKGIYESWILNEWRFNLYTISDKNINGITLFICKKEDFNENE